MSSESIYGLITGYRRGVAKFRFSDRERGFSVKMCYGQIDLDICTTQHPGAYPDTYYINRGSSKTLSLSCSIASYIFSHTEYIYKSSGVPLDKMFRILHF